MDTYNPSKLTAKPIKSDLTLRQLADFDESGGSRNRVDNVRSNQVLVSLSNINRPQTFSFRYISDLIKGGTGIASSTKDGVTTISNSGVTKIIAGTNITISPVTGVGDVTVNAASGGITSLNLLTAAAQTFVNDTNVSIVSSGTTHTLTWLGTLADSRIASASTWNAKQDALVSGTNIKTINSTSLLGSGNITVGTFTLPSLTSGSVLFSDGTTIAQNNANFFWDNTNGRLGIGTASPNSRVNALDGTVSELKFNSGYLNLTPSLAVGNTGGSGKFACLIAGTSAAAFIYDSAGYFDIATDLKSNYTANTLGGSNYASKMRVQSNGNVQIGTTTDVASSKLTIASTTQGFLRPRMTAAQKTAIASPATGLSVYDTDINSVNFYNGVSWVDRGSNIEAGKKVLSFFTDFLSNNALDGLQTFASGGTAGTVGGTLIPGRTIQQGVVFLQTAAVATNYIFHSSGTVQLWLGGGVWNYETSIYIPTLSTVTDRYRFLFGFGSGTTNSTETDGVFLTYDEGGTANGTVASANWQCVTVQNSTRTLTTTTTAVAATAWLKLRIEINAAATSVTFYVNGTAIATHTTNIPVPNRYILVKQGVAKTIGTTSLGFYCDYIGYENILTTPR